VFFFFLFFFFFFLLFLFFFFVFVFLFFFFLFFAFFFRGGVWFGVVFFFCVLCLWVVVLLFFFFFFFLCVVVRHPLNFHGVFWWVPTPPGTDPREVLPEDFTSGFPFFFPVPIQERHLWGSVFLLSRTKSVPFFYVFDPFL